MGFFDRFKKKPRPAPEKPPETPSKAAPDISLKEDTMALLLMDRVLDGIDPAVDLLRKAFGDKAVGDIDTSHPRVPACTVTLDGLEFWVSYLPMPLPPSDLDVPTAAKYNIFLSPEEKAAFAAHKSFWVLAQKGGGTSLPEKRRVCWTFSKLCAAMLDLDGAIGVNPKNRGGLLVSKRSYLNYAAQMEKTAWDNGDGYFPVPLWVWLYITEEKGRQTIQTCGMNDFGLPEMAFYDPKLPVPTLMNYLFTMSSRQITQREVPYRNAIVVPLNEHTEVVCKEENGVLYFIGA